MTPPEDLDDRLFGEAVNLAIRLQSPDPSGTEAAIRSWCARSADHARIWAEVAEIQGLAHSALAGPPRPAPGIERRKLLGAAIGLAGLGAVAGLAGPGLVTAARADHRTGTAEQQDIALPDGSRLTLGPDSAVALAPPGHRGLRLLSGMVVCDIAPGPTPFHLAIDRLDLHSDHALLCVSAERAGTSVTLEHGALSVDHPSRPRRQLASGHWQRLDAQGDALEQAPRPPGEATAWTDQRLVTQSEALAVLVEQIARWLPGRVVLADAGLGRKRVAGSFDLRHPEAALQAVIHPHGGRLRRISPWLRVISAV